MTETLLVTTAIFVSIIFVCSRIPISTPHENCAARTKVVSRFNFRNLVLATAFMPLSAFIVTILISVFRDLEATTKTHCNVVNVLPSVSASIGDFSPQRYIWRTAIALHCGPRLLMAYTHYSWLKLTHQDAYVDMKTYQLFCTIVLWSDVLEIFSLQGLTSVSSSEYFAFHEGCTVVFLMMSFLYMTVINILFKWKSGRCRNIQNTLSVRLKFICWCAVTVSIVMMAYLYWRHNQYCEPYIYSGFAFFEYMVVIATIVVHGTVMLDLHDKELTVLSIGERYLQDV
ncbi:post-GPI attachment to proteins factor 2-like [Glandiceps talaboti]